VPREDRLVRFYVQLAETGSEEDDFDPEKVDFETILHSTSNILSPYELESWLLRLVVCIHSESSILLNH